MKKISLIVLLGISLISVAQTKNAKPFVLGYTEELESKILSEKRTINIYLPEGYKTNDTIHYPVIYLLDGGADEDFIHTVGLVQYNNFSWINRVPPSIVVGIANTDRKRDFTYPSQVEAEKKRYPSSGGSAKFIEFIEKELQPYVEKNYKSTKGKTLIGQSLGGLLATEILFKKPQLFDQYIIISPSLWWNDGSLLKENPVWFNENFITKKKIYIGVGKEGIWASTPTTPHVMEVDANLLADKLRAAKNKNLTIYFDYMPEEDHATSSHPAVFNAFRLLYPKK
ncbi:MAG: alpha/beta hydrolase-fold protein [Flavobacteriaceae bacterium]